MNNILITGAGGQLGSEMRVLSSDKSNCTYWYTDISVPESLNEEHFSILDITDASAVLEFVERNKINIVVNCAAYTNVDSAESNYEVADLLNNKAVANIAEACVRNGAYLIHISTDYVFGDSTTNRPYKEDDPVNPLGVYGKTKLAGEQAIRRIMGEESSNYLIIRTAWLYSSFGHNFVKTMLKLAVEHENVKVVNDQYGTPTYAADLSKVIYKLIEEDMCGDKVSGLFNYSNLGVCTWFDFAKEIMKLSRSTCKVIPCDSSEFPSNVERPKYSVLDKSKIINTLGLKIPVWQESLERAIKLIVL